MRSWHTTCILVQQLKNIGFPGWPEHNLDCVLVLGGQLTKGACTGPLFIFVTDVSLATLLSNSLQLSASKALSTSLRPSLRPPSTRPHQPSTQPCTTLP